MEEPIHEVFSPVPRGMDFILELVLNEEGEAIRPFILFPPISKQRAQPEQRQNSKRSLVHAGKKA